VSLKEIRLCCTFFSDNKKYCCITMEKKCSFVDQS